MEPNSTLEEGYRVTINKREANILLESPRKRLRGACEPTEVTVEDVAAKGSKRKASAETETPSKKQRGGPNVTDTITNTSEPTTVSVVNVRANKNKKEDTDFEAKYLEFDILGEGGFGSVYAGNRKKDNLPVAIKHIPKVDVECRPVVLKGKIYRIPMEVFLMLQVGAGPSSAGKSAAVSLLDWYDLDEEVLLVMERPVSSVDLLTYMDDNDGPLDEDTAKVLMLQLVEAAINMHSKGVFHRDIKSENILIETGSNVPRVRIIDFGCGCIVKKRPYRCFSGTPAYGPPEFQISGSYEAGPTTVWQLGALLYEMLDGYKRFNTSKFIRKKIKFNSEMSRDCRGLLRMCLALNPTERATLEQMQLHPWFT
ncbi:serine/threonine-protein kinase pim-2-like [Xiphias gladius]|uniref:serine/threonine-protein kinase pim-2-like n=1 Tax=Xiphias gladius TaxID=8245 RepID=UPI001A983B74|nr:serine/threonine-protein kinase pim-2-like [Xiphias gladius]